MCNGNGVGLFGLQLRGDRAVEGSHDQLDVLADEAIVVGQKGAGEQTTLAEHLESIANTQHKTALLSESQHLFHDGRKTGDGSRS